LSEGQVGSAEVPVVERNQESSPGHLGAALNMRGFLTAQVIFVEPRGPADRAGLRVGDTIVSVDGASITNLDPYAVQSLITDRGPGKEARLAVLRGGATTTLSVILGAPLAY
jgi:S1-C subfamily serine protease